jgi:hypothetical protein
MQMHSGGSGTTNSIKVPLSQGNEQGWWWQEAS